MKAMMEKKPKVDKANGAPPTLPPAAAIEMKYVLRKEIQRDENQPRKEFAQDKLQELADSIREIGIRQPIQVEWVTGLELKTPDLISKNWSVAQGAKILFSSDKEQEARDFIASRPGGFYRIVFGERRWRAAELAGLERIPVVVVDTSSPEWPKQKLAIQVAENLHRENLTALEEALAYRRELEAKRHTAESLHKMLGVSRAHLFSRLALNRLPEFAIDYLKAGRISVSVAGLIPMIPKEEQQKKFLEDVAAGAASQWEGFRPRSAASFREAQDTLEEEFCQQLKGAPFDLKDADLVPAEWVIRNGTEECGFKEFKARGQAPVLATDKGAMETQSRLPDNGWAIVEGQWGDQFTSPPPGSPLAMVGKDLPVLVDGVSKKDAKELAALIKGKVGFQVTRVMGGACTDCPFRSGNLAEYPDAEKRPNVCTKPACYHQKVKAHWVRKAGDAVKRGAEVLDITTYKRTRGEYVEANKEIYIGNNYSTPKKALGKKAPPVILATTEKGLIPVYKRAEAKKAGLKLNEHRSGAPSAEDKAKEAEKERKAKERTEARQKLIKTNAPTIGAAVAELSERDAWKLVGELVDTRGGGRTEGFREEMKSAVKTERDKLICDLLSGYSDHPLDWQGNWETKIAKRWKDLGVDLVALEKETEKKAEKTAGGGALKGKA